MEQLKRIRSGIDGIDAILKGGLIAVASYIVQGRPGSGKTILAHQIAFNHVRDGGRALVATLLSESHERLFQFLSTLSFFDKDKVGNEIQFISAFDTLENEGLEQVVKLVRMEISRHNTSVLIVDGLLNARTKANTQLDTKTRAWKASMASPRNRTAPTSRGSKAASPASTALSAAACPAPR